jgi:hypothetical protein
MAPFIFFGGQRKRSKRKAALNLAFGSPREAAACGGATNSPDLVGLRQCGAFIRMQPLREAALNVRKPGKVSPSRADPKSGPLDPDFTMRKSIRNDRQTVSR